MANVWGRARPVIGFIWGQIKPYVLKSYVRALPTIGNHRTAQRPKIYDCFMFANELDVLDIRLRELYDVVDYFVIVEATHSHKGVPKPLYFADNQSRFQEFAAKIRHIVIDDMPMDTADPWVRENHQRQGITRGLADAQPHDWIIVSDADEIPRPAAVQTLRNCQYSMVGYHMSVSYFRLNYVATRMERDLVWTVAYRHGVGVTPQEARNLRKHLHNRALQMANPHTVGAIRYGGWHFSYLGDADFVANKIRISVCHQELDMAKAESAVDIQQFLDSGRDLYDRLGYAWEVTPLTDFFPQTIMRNPDAYAHLIAPWRQ